MPSSLSALAIIAAFVAPGLLFEEGIARLISYRRTEDLSRRTLRFIAWSLVFHALAAPVTFSFWSKWIRGRTVLEGTRLALHEYGIVRCWMVLIVATILPFALGLMAGKGVKSRSRLSGILVGQGLEPTAWEWMWYHGDPGWVRAKLKSGH